MRGWIGEGIEPHAIGIAARAGYLAYAAQFGLGVLLLVDSHDSDQLINLSFIIFVTLIVSLQRAWSLLKGKHVASAHGSAMTGDHDPPRGPDPGSFRLHPWLQKRRGRVR